MKRLTIALSIMLLAASCSTMSTVLTNQNPQTQISATSSDLSISSGQQTYTSGQYGYSISYQADFSFSPDVNQVRALSYIQICDDLMVGCVYYSGSAYQGTNFDGAAVSINIDPTLNSQDKCYNFNNQYSEAQTAVADVTINGIIFKSATGGGGAAGHFDKLQIYRNFGSGNCYEIVQDVAETDIGNYTPGTVTQFDENAVWQKLQGIVNSFKFMD